MAPNFLPKIFKNFKVQSSLILCHSLKNLRMAKALTCISPVKETFLPSGNGSSDQLSSVVKRKLEEIEVSPQKKLHSKIPSVLSKDEARPFTVSIEGNIGSGKSTFLKYFSSVPGLVTMQEPISEWTNCGGHNLLDMLYQNSTRWNFLFQSYVQLTRLNIHTSHSKSSVKLIERSFQNNRFCFVECAYKEGNLKDSEYLVLDEYFKYFEKHSDIGVDLIVYLKTTPEVVYERVKKRARLEEATMPLSYLQTIHDYYEKWLGSNIPQSPPAPVLVIDANKEIDSVIKEFETNRMMILGKQKPQCSNMKKL